MLQKLLTVGAFLCIIPLLVFYYPVYNNYVKEYPVEGYELR
jgi:hypothetical protein